MSELSQVKARPVGVTILAIHHHQCDHPALLYASWREVSFWHGLVDVSDGEQG
jgi:hypothetical protein